MQEISIEEIQSKALGFDQNGVKWHFHILTPSCKFNTKSDYAFVLEGPDDSQQFVHYSKEAPSDLGKELAPLAHKAKVLDQKSTDDSYRPSEIVQKIIARAKELNQQGVEWHHHVTFHGCQFNKGVSNFTLIFEDPETGKTIESPSESEPINDLKQIEPLFYSQKH
ncbi:MAG TPA: hypothetical protein VLE51_01130 [Candidatus Saccharimonadales bacterium]|nr:hypothetical protein [Candidatus Saccharimonadales bacterium]